MNNVFRNSAVQVVEMAPSSLAVNEKNRKLVGLPEYSDSEFIDVLYLSGPHPNKRIHCLAQIFLNLSKLDPRFRLVVTLPEGLYLDRVLSSFDQIGVSHLVVNVGPVEPSNILEVFSSASAVINVARLESFSNNWVEAWAFSRPLIVSDYEWARASCGDAAIYVDVFNPREAAQAIFDGVLSSRNRQSLIEEGFARLDALPSSEEKFCRYIAIIESLIELGAK